MIDASLDYFLREFAGRSFTVTGDSEVDSSAKSFAPAGDADTSDGLAATQRADPVAHRRHSRRLSHRQSDLRSWNTKDSRCTRLELATIGDPVSDFAYFAMNWILPPDGRSGLGGIDLRSRGLPSLEEVIARYCAAIGLDGLPHLNWYFAFNLFLLVSILQGIRKRALDGNAASAGADSVVARIPTIAALPGSRRALPARPKEGRYELI